MRTTYSDLSAKLVEMLPELRQWHEALLRDWGGEAPGQHIVYGDLLNPYIGVLLDSGQSSENLSQVFGLLEDLASIGDLPVQEVVEVTVPEFVVGHGWSGQFIWRPVHAKAAMGQPAAQGE